MTVEKVLKLNVVKEKGFLYFLRNDGVWRTKLRRQGQPKGRKERVVKATYTRDPLWLYFLDKEGDISRFPGGNRGRIKPTAPAPRIKK